VTNEEFYDAEIAQALADLAKICQKRGMAFLAAVEYEPNKVGSTSLIPATAGIEINLTSMAMQANGNVDALYFALKRHADMFGHSSVVLHMLGSKEKAAL
jgi:hypothetical protein